MSPKEVIYWENDPISHLNLSILLLNLFNCQNLRRVRYNAVALNLSPDPRVIAGPYSTVHAALPNIPTDQHALTNFESKKI